MKNYLKNLLLGIPLALGLMLTLIAVVMVMTSDSDQYFHALVCGLIGIPLLFASLAAIARRQ